MRLSEKDLRAVIHFIVVTNRIKLIFFVISIEREAASMYWDELRPLSLLMSGVVSAMFFLLSPLSEPLLAQASALTFLDPTLRGEVEHRDGLSEGGGSAVAIDWHSPTTAIASTCVSLATN